MADKSDDDGLLVLLAKGLRDLRKQVANLARQPGPAGKDGVGIPGRDGAAGTNGVNGKDGADGRDGRDGIDGAPGKDGEPGAVGTMPKHEWDGTKLRFQLSPKKWGKWVDLRGPASKSGGGVAVAPCGGQSWNPDSLPVAADDTPEEFIVKQDGTWRRATYAQMATWLGASGPAIGNGILTEDGSNIITEDGRTLVQE